MAIDLLDCSEFQTGCFDPDSVRELCFKLNEVIGQVNENTIAVAGNGNGGNFDFTTDELPYDFDPDNFDGDNCFVGASGTVRACARLFANDDGGANGTGSINATAPVFLLCDGVVVSQTVATISGTFNVSMGSGSNTTYCVESSFSIPTVPADSVCTYTLAVGSVSGTVSTPIDVTQSTLLSGGAITSATLGINCV